MIEDRHVPTMTVWRILCDECKNALMHGINPERGQFLCAECHKRTSASE